MKSYRIFATGLALAAWLAIGSVPVHAQAEAAAAAVAAPVVVRVINAITPEGKPAGSNWMKAEVIHADSTTIVVREQKNERMIHTFNFSADLKDKMQAILDRGGFQYGDRVSVLFMPGQTVALRIHGRPSKSL